MNQPKPKKEKFRKYQYTKPFKQRDKTKDFGKDLPLKKSGRLKFPEKPQYYTLYTVKRLETTHPFFNIRNKDIAEVKRAIEKATKQLQRQNKINNTKSIEPKDSQMKNNTIMESKQQMKSNKSLEPKDSQMNKSSSSILNSSAFADSQSKSSVFAQSSNLSSLDVVTISSKKSKENPFSKGYSVTSGPKIYSKVSQKNESRDVSAVNTPKVSVLSDKQMVGKSVMKSLSLSNLSHLGQQLSL